MGAPAREACDYETLSCRLQFWSAGGVGRKIAVGPVSFGAEHDHQTALELISVLVLGVWFRLVSSGPKHARQTALDMVSVLVLGVWFRLVSLGPRRDRQVALELVSALVLGVWFRLRHPTHTPASEAEALVCNGVWGFPKSFRGPCRERFWGTILETPKPHYKPHYSKDFRCNLRCNGVCNGVCGFPKSFPAKLGERFWGTVLENPQTPLQTSAYAFLARSAVVFPRSRHTVPPPRPRSPGRHGTGGRSPEIKEAGRCGLSEKAGQTESQPKGGRCGQTEKAGQIDCQTRAR